MGRMRWRKASGGSTWRFWSPCFELSFEWRQETVPRWGKSNFNKQKFNSKNKQISHTILSFKIIWTSYLCFVSSFVIKKKKFHQIFQLILFHYIKSLKTHAHIQTQACRHIQEQQYQNLNNSKKKTSIKKSYNYIIRYTCDIITLYFFCHCVGWVSDRGKSCGQPSHVSCRFSEWRLHWPQCSEEANHPQD